MNGARRNPEERRRRIIQAALELIPEVGVGGLTHRLVAARADVPLGATTYYFTSLDDLAHTALTAAAELTAEGLRSWAEALRTGPDLPATLATLIDDYLGDRSRMLIWNELYAAAGHRPELRPLAREWSDGLTRLLAGYVDHQTARAVAAFIDGILLHALIHDRPLAPGTVAGSLAALMTPPR
ncbi:DNA-binding transcriptional regulator [Streptosporangium violaceochromogenes]|nr:DNA-binding transcriptional regulator [Streptosporangium violaceochromogenes]